MQKITEILSSFVNFINTTLVPLIFAIAFVVFLYGVFRYFILGADNEEKRATGRQLVVYSIIGFAIMVSVWGLVNLVVGTFGFKDTTRPDLPTFGGSSSGSSAKPSSTLTPTVTSSPIPSKVIGPPEP